MLPEDNVPPARDRRRFVMGGLASLGLLALPAAPAWARGFKPAKTSIKQEPEKSLAFYNTHTGESLKVVYCCEGLYPPESLKEINHILRDHRTESVHPIDVELLDVLYRLHRKMDTPEPFHIISGYRSPETNTMLRARRKHSGVAKRSLHMDGRAVDIRLPGRDLADLRQAALSLETGGVGYYPKSDFVHVDVGPVRSW